MFFITNRRSFLDNRKLPKKQKRIVQGNGKKEGGKIENVSKVIIKL